MVNQVRTLLLNARPWVGTDLPYGEEYVPDEYLVRRLTPPLIAARAALFGSNPDRAGLNLTLARILAVLHTSPFVSDVTADDARITYDPARPVDVFGSLGPAVLEGTEPVSWAGSARFVDSGRAYGRWTVTTDGAGNYEVTPYGTGVLSTGTVTASDVGDAVPLPGSYLNAVVPTDASGSWSVALLTPPTHSFVTATGLTDTVPLFRPSGGTREAAWYAAWNGRGPSWHRAAALALALAARTNELGAS